MHTSLGDLIRVIALLTIGLVGITMIPQMGNQVMKIMTDISTEGKDEHTAVDDDNDCDKTEYTIYTFAKLVEEYSIANPATELKKIEINVPGDDEKASVAVNKSQESMVSSPEFKRFISGICTTKASQYILKPSQNNKDFQIYENSQLALVSDFLSDASIKPSYDSTSSDDKLKLQEYYNENK